MPLLCVQCALRALVEGQPTPLFEEDNLTHMRLFHPDPQETEREREELEKQLSRLLRTGFDSREKG